MIQNLIDAHLGYSRFCLIHEFKHTGTTTPIPEGSKGTMYSYIYGPNERKLIGFSSPTKTGHVVLVRMDNSAGLGLRPIEMNDICRYSFHAKPDSVLYIMSLMRRGVVTGSDLVILSTAYMDMS